MQLVQAESSTGTSELENQDAPKAPNIETRQKVVANCENSASDNCTDEKKKVSKKRRKSNTRDKYSSDSEEYYKREPAKNKYKKANTEDPLHANNNSICNQKLTLACSFSNIR